MDPHGRGGREPDGDIGRQLSNLGNTFLTYLKTRQPEHWLFLAIGVIIGLWIG